MKLKFPSRLIEITIKIQYSRSMKHQTRYKYSRQREDLYNLLCSVKTHPTAAWLYNTLKKDHPHLSQGTVYRNLNILADQQRIKIITIDGEFAHFDADMSMHNHVICTQCGKVEDVYAEPHPTCEAAAAEQSGYQINTHRLDFFGICPICRKKIYTG